MALDTLEHSRPERIALVTDFGAGAYVGQLRLLAAGLAPIIPVVDLLHDLPAFRPDLAAYLLPGLIQGMPARTLYLCVVDPGVGGERAALVLRCGQNWFVAPDNGLLGPLARRCAPADRALWRIDWRPSPVSDSSPQGAPQDSTQFGAQSSHQSSHQFSETFHGRDLFLPIALALTQGRLPMPSVTLSLADIRGHDDPLDLDRVLYIDRYGNLMTGLALERAAPDARIRSGQRSVGWARTFCEVAAGAAFWYRNAFGLVEIAVNQGRADRLLGVSVGDAVAWETPGC